MIKNVLIVFLLFFTTTLFGQTKYGKEPASFLPAGYVIIESINGDLNKDGLADYVLIIKGTDKANIIKDEHRGKVDKNRRGIIVLFNRKHQYELALKNYNCFSSENEDGGVYFPPELSVTISKGNLYIQYSHGRYGYWNYTFRFRTSDFELIGYDASSNRGPIVERKTSINFLTRKKRTKENSNNDPEQESGEEIFKETWTSIKIEKPIRLSMIKDFDELDLRY